MPHTTAVCIRLDETLCSSAGRSQLRLGSQCTRYSVNMRLESASLHAPKWQFPNHISDIFGTYIRLWFYDSCNVEAEAGASRLSMHSMPMCWPGRYVTMYVWQLRMCKPQKCSQTKPMTNRRRQSTHVLALATEWLGHGARRQETWGVGHLSLICRCDLPVQCSKC